jgi:hypothetical protein
LALGRHGALEHLRVDPAGKRTEALAFAALPGTLLEHLAACRGLLRQHLATCSGRLAVASTHAHQIVLLEVSLAHYTGKWRSVKAVAALQRGDIGPQDLHFGPDYPTLAPFFSVLGAVFELFEAFFHALELLAHLVCRLSTGHQ